MSSVKDAGGNHELAPLPSTETRRVFSKEAAEQAGEVCGGTVVLVVDDDAGISAAIRNLCVLNNVRCVHASSVQDGLEAISDLEFLDVMLHGVLVDLRLPDGAGYRIIDLCHARWPKLPAAVMTAFPDDGLIRWLQETGVPLLLKPFPVQSVLAWLNEARGFSAA